MTARHAAPARHAPPRQLWWLVYGFAVWGAGFVTIYGIHALGCAYGWSLPTHRLVMGGLLGVHLAVLGAGLVLARRVDWAGTGDGVLIERATVWTLLAAIVATIATFAPPALFLTVCI